MQKWSTHKNTKLYMEKSLLLEERKKLRENRVSLWRIKDYMCLLYGG